MLHSPRRLAGAAGKAGPPRRQLNTVGGGSRITLTLTLTLTLSPNPNPNPEPSRSPNRIPNPNPNPNHNHNPDRCRGQDNACARRDER